jgi:hypothetical protein
MKEKWTTLEMIEHTRGRIKELDARISEWVMERALMDQVPLVLKVCPRCNGYGRVREDAQDSSERCDVCAGTGSGLPR